MSPMPHSVDSCIDEWKRKLIDLTRRNRLLFFTSTRSSSLRIAEPSPADVFRRLVIDEKPWKFFMPPEEERGRRESEAHSDLPLGIFNDQRLPLPKSPRRPDELFCTAREGRTLRSVLRNLHRRSRTDFEERGIRILHVAFGILEWREVEQSEVVRSPLLLAPAEMKRASVNDPFTLSAAEEEIVVNPALEVRLRRDFRLELPPLPDDWDETSLDDYLSQIARRIHRLGWSVSPECWIGLFSFHKLVIYQDLNSHHERIQQHPILIALCTRDGKGLANGDLPDPRKLDSIIDPRESYLVLDADSSQLACIEAVKKGTHLLIQGPPGTGKSQTIANVIAESIAAGHTALFMSEKMAALEMVYKRLLTANLGHFCLELHSHKANKREVVAELYRSYLESLQPGRVMTELEFQQLVERRRQLNDYVYALHLVHEPLEKSAYEVLGQLAELERVPFVPPGEIDVGTLTPARLDRAEQLAQRLARLWTVVAEGDRFPWIGCTAASYGLETRTTFQNLVSICERVVVELAEESKRLATALGLPSPVSLSEAEWLLRTGKLLREGPGVPENWLTTQELDPFVSGAKRYHELSGRWRALRDELSGRYHDRLFELPISISEELRSLLEAISSYLGRDVLSDSLVVFHRSELLSWVHDLIRRMIDWQKETSILCNLLGLSSDNLNIERLERLVEIAELCSRDSRPDRGWFDPFRLEEVRDLLPRLRQGYETRAAVRERVLQDYDLSFLSLDLNGLIEDRKVRYASVLRWLKPGFYRFRRQVRQCRRDGQFPASILKDLVSARDLKRLEAKIESESERTGKILGSWYRGYDTNFGRVEGAVEVARRLLDLVTNRPVPKQLVELSCLGAIPSADLTTTATRLKQGLAVWEEQTVKFHDLLPLDLLPLSRLPLRQSRLEDVLVWARRLVEPLHAAISLLDAVESSLRSPLARPAREILTDLSKLRVLFEIQSQVLQEADRLRAAYSERFVGLQTAWGDILAALEWARTLRNHLGDRSIPESLLERARLGAKGAPEVDPLTERMALFCEAFAQLETHFEQGHPRLETLPLRECSLEAQRIRLTEMRERVDELRDWVDYQSVKKDFHQARLPSLLANLVRGSLQSEVLPDVVRRALLEAWIASLFAQEPALGQFRAQDHEALIAEFRELDRKHWKLGAHRVISEANKSRPQGDIVVPGGEEQVLIREANKKKRHLPIRRLFAQIPNLLIRLKPCLLMSPLSISQFLDPDQLKFDRVIFDEASQIRTEDAVGAIYRGRQLVVCGDNKQLPPTAFFDQGMSEEYDDQDVEEAFDVFDSILDECASIGIPQRWLRWHYRSRHEALIAFSNHRFYENRLVTFPASKDNDPRLGIEFKHVPDGVYDRGERRDNPREAEVVVDLVKKHFLRYPQRSVGVVAFSLAQMNAIEDRIEQLIRERPELQRYFKEDRLEGFFVKNLENVQGDERDVIIFSVGYGRDQQARLTMHFGPLNLAGGERRLNVAVTRAREKVIVVSSIRAADFDLSATQAPGVLALYGYLDYAERGPEALQVGHPGGQGEFESPLERDVAAAIRALGYEVVPQVGCSGFRIDLGIVDPARPGRFLLGVECDGATYHSAYTARDRDRLRQQILEDLGWRIHRVWSPDWVTRHDTEVRRLREAIDRARASGENLAQAKNSAEEVTPPIVEQRHPPLADSDSSSQWAILYKVWKPQMKPPQGVPFYAPAAREVLIGMLREVIEVEGPVHMEVATHRIANAWGLQRVGSRMMKTVNTALRSLTRGGEVRKHGEFLWSSRSESQLAVRRPEPGNKDTLRGIEYISQEELELAVKNLVRDALSISDDELIRQVARVFGFDRTGINIRERMETIVRQLISRGVLVSRGDRISLP